MLYSTAFVWCYMWCDTMAPMTQEIAIYEPLSMVLLGSYLSPFEPKTPSQVPCATRIFKFIWRGLTFNVMRLNLFWEIKDSYKEACHMYALAVSNGDVFYIKHELLASAWSVEKIKSYQGVAWYLNRLNGIHSTKAQRLQ